MKDPMRVAVTGAAGQIGYSLLFRIASGQMLGPDQPVVLQMLEITPALGALEGVAMELDDCAFPLLAGHGARPTTPRWRSPTSTSPCWWGRCGRKAGMERADLLSANGAIFTTQGGPSTPPPTGRQGAGGGQPGQHQRPHRQRNAPGLDPSQFTAMTRLDHNRAKSQLAHKLGPVTSITRMTIWGNHSTTQYPDLFHCEVDGFNAYEAVGDHAWVEETFIPTVAKRGAAVIEARGASSAASAANAAIDHVRDWVLGTPEGDWVSMAWCPTAATACRTGSSLVPGHLPRAAAGRSSRVSRSTTSPGRGSTPAPPSSCRSGMP
jgi:malate dehydrogenase